MRSHKNSIKLSMIESGETQERKRIFAKNLATLLNEVGMQQQEFAEAIGCAKSTVCSWKNGQAFPAPELFPAIVNTLNTTLDELFLSREHRFCPRCGAEVDEHCYCKKH